LPAGDSLAAFKTCNKLSQVMARAEADAAGADEALLTNTNRFIVEGAGSNLFWLRRGILYTPPLAAGILPGVTRAVVMEIASRLKIPVREKNIRLKELLQSDGVFLSLSSFGVVEAKSIDGNVLTKSPVTTQIARRYGQLLVDSSACNARAEN
jgi:branched-subunit amino acid aminotransferase/4-amino-4-deoxychorismate lyase